MAVECPNCGSVRVYYRRRRAKPLAVLFGQTAFRCKDCKKKFDLSNSELTGKSLTGWRLQAMAGSLLGGPLWRPVLLVGIVLLAVAAGPRYLRWQEAQRLQQSQTEPPTAIAVLGGGVKREIAAAQLARRYPGLPVLVLGGSSQACLERIFALERGIPMNRVMAEYRSAATLTNLTALTALLGQGKAQKVLLVTDRGNWERARTLANLVLGGNGIAFVPALIAGSGSINDNTPLRGESEQKTLLQSLLALGWLLVGDAVLPERMNNPPARAAQLEKLPESGACTDGYPAYVDLAVLE